MTDYPKTVEEIYEDYKHRKAGLMRALTEDLEEFYAQCDPDKENLCLYGEKDATWTVDLPAEEVPPELPEPCLGINFARDGMNKRDWVALVAVHSDAWLVSVAFFYGVRLDTHNRLRLFRLINQSPTLFEVVTTNRKGFTPVAKPSFSGLGPPTKRKKSEAVRTGHVATGPTDTLVPSGRLLTDEDITPALKGRQAELFWPDDQKWYFVTIQAVNHRTKQAKIVYASGEEEELSLDEMAREGHMTLIGSD